MKNKKKTNNKKYKNNPKINDKLNKIKTTISKNKSGGYFDDKKIINIENLDINESYICWIKYTKFNKKSK